MDRPTVKGREMGSDLLEEKNCTVAAKGMNMGRNEALGPFSNCPHHFNLQSYLQLTASSEKLDVQPRY